MADTVREKLLALRDESYRAFQCKLMPTVDPARVIGVRTPALRQLARELRGTAETEAFLSALPHTYYEENNLHSFLIGEIRDFGAALAAVETFLPYVDNWATCDGLSPKALGKDLTALYDRIGDWVRSERTYTVRFGIEMLMTHFLGGNFRPEAAALAASVHSEEYYIRMMVAWYFATALAKNYDAVLPVLTQRQLDPWTHNKTIQKAVESYRISDETKAYLRTLKLR